ncbi:DUF2690 domain-containing protein [Embleya sp. AB8]|uniref:DUF2690 domain-containing protein n=1 Tax=Embleya sp. AB8 TaxID=3156304 RepID=UPI003C73FF00
MSGDEETGGRQEDPAEELRRLLLELKEEAELSYVRLGAKTHYAKSSWERWLNGKQFPPRDAVLSMAQVCGGDVSRVLDLWDRAQGAPGAQEPADEQQGIDDPGEAVESGPAEGESRPGEPAPVEPAVHRGWWPFGRRVTYVVAVLAVVAVTLAILVPALWSSDGGTGGGAGKHAAPSVGARQSGNPGTPGPTAEQPLPSAVIAPGCSGPACEGQSAQAMRCGSGAATAATATTPTGIVVELRYSSVCHAAWARITYASPDAVVEVDSADGRVWAAPVHWGYDAYTAMLAVPDTGMEMWGCGTAPHGGPRGCTAHTLVSLPQ